MTRQTGQLTTRQAILGGLAILAFVAGIAAALALLLQREEQLQPLEAPAEPAEPVGSQPCPATPRRGALVPSGQLIECPDVFDGQVVRYRGEAVRAVLDRSDRAWVHLNDDPYALDLGPLPAHRTAVGGNSGIPVSIPADVAVRITHVGDARHQGDILDITGTYHRADPRDDGGPAIQAHLARIHQAGRPLAHHPSPGRAITALVIAVFAVVTAVAAHYRPLSRP